VLGSLLQKFLELLTRELFNFVVGKFVAKVSGTFDKGAF